MAKYDLFIAGRWRNKDNIKSVLEIVRASGKTAYCFIENDYAGEKVAFAFDDDTEKVMQDFEALAQDDAHVRQIFANDMKAEKESSNFLLVLPAGISGHIEAGVAYGLGKKCYAVGAVEKTESLYGIFDQIFPDTESLQEWLRSS